MVNFEKADFAVGPPPRGSLCPPAGSALIPAHVAIRPIRALRDGARARHQTMGSSCFDSIKAE